MSSQVKTRKTGFRPGSGRSLLLTAVIAIILSFVVASVVMWITGINPQNFFSALFRTLTGLDLGKIGEKGFFKPRYVGEFLQTSMPLILAALGVGFANRCGLFNIGAEGQVIAGIVGADLVALLLNWDSPYLVVVAVLAAGVAGALWAFIPGFLKAYFGVHEVVTTIMFNYVALRLNNWILTSLPGSDPQRTVDLPQNALLENEWLKEITGKSRMHMGFIVVIVCIFLYHFIINKTSFGFELRSVGYNQHASQYAGMNSKTRTVQAMLISGMFAGLAGAMVALGTFKYGRVLAGFENYGFDGLAVSLLGGNTAVGILLGGLLLGSLRSGQPLMQAMRVPLEIAQIVSALIILFVAMQHGIERILVWFFNRRQARETIGAPEMIEPKPEVVLTNDNAVIENPVPPDTEVPVTESVDTKEDSHGSV